MNFNDRHWKWHLAAHVYERFYPQIAHQLDTDLFRYLGPRTRGAVVADCGCGPGVVAEKLLRQGAALVIAVDVNGSMLRRAQARLSGAIAAGRVMQVQRAFDPHLFSDLRDRFTGGASFDIILFKRSLYLKPGLALMVLRGALTALNPGGVLVVIHPERSVRRYAFGAWLRPQRYTPLHLINRGLSLLAEKLRASDYTLYTQAELLGLLRTAAPGRPIEVIPSRQQAYNLAAVLNRG